MEKPLKFKITAKDIKTGEPYSHSLCPIANSLRRYFGKGKTVGVSNYAVYVSEGNSVKVYRLNDKATNFIQRFDHSGKVKPTTITVTFDFRYKRCSCGFKCKWNVQ